MDIRIIRYNSSDYLQMIQLRDDVLRKPLGLRIADDPLEKEEKDILIGAFDDTGITGCCIITKADDKTARLRQMAVRERVRGTGIGSRLIHFAEDIARNAGYGVMTLHARKSAKEFYEKMGYKIHGEVFTEVTIPHFPMIKSLCPTDRDRMEDLPV